jgi:hypothetical protein
MSCEGMGYGFACARDTRSMMAFGESVIDRGMIALKASKYAFSHSLIGRPGVPRSLFWSCRFTLFDLPGAYEPYPPS